MKIFTKISFLAFALFWALSPARAAFGGQVVDSIVATVNGHVILQSDLDEALAYEAVLNGRPPSQFTDDERRAVLDRLIDQELLREQMNSTEFKHATEAEAEERVKEARRQYPGATTEQGWQAVLKQFGVTEKDLMQHVRQQIDLMRLVDARLRPAVQIDSKSIEDYYREKFARQLPEAGSPGVALAEVSGKIRELLTQQKVNELLVAWLETLRAASDVHMPGSSAAPIQEIR